MAHQVFISYTQPDKNEAFAIHDALIAEGISAWVAGSVPDGVISGNPYKAEIVKGIEGCMFFVLLYSSYVNGSDAVKRELSLAEKKKIFVIRLDKSDMCAELIHDLKRLEQIDATDKNMPATVWRLIHDIRDHLSKFTPTESLSTDKVLLRKGIRLFSNQLYADAKILLLQYRSIMPQDAEGRFYLALCMIAGRRPEKLDGLVVQQAEAILLPCAADMVDVHARWLLAFIKYGYYQMNHIREKPPYWQQLIECSLPGKEYAAAITTACTDPANQVWQLLKKIV